MWNSWKEKVMSDIKATAYCIFVLCGSLIQFLHFQVTLTLLHGSLWKKGGPLQK